MKKFIIFNFIVFTLLCFESCYTLRGFSIDPNVNTYYVKTFENTALNAPPTIGQTFTEQFKNKVRVQTRLKYNDVSPDLEFIGSITDYTITPEAPQPNATASFNKLEIAVLVECINNKDNSKNWKQRFTRFLTYSTDKDLLTIQETLVNDISNLLLEDIFRKAFEDW